MSLVGEANHKRIYEEKIEYVKFTIGNKIKIAISQADNPAENDKISIQNKSSDH